MNAAGGSEYTLSSLHLGYYVDPATGKYCAIADDAKSCVCGRCIMLGCFPTLQEVVDALIEFAKNALLVLGVLLLAWIIAEIIEVIIAIEILPPRARPLEPCLPSTVLVTRINIVGRDATSPSGSNQVFNLQGSARTDPRGPPPT